MEELTEEYDPEYEEALRKYFRQCLMMEGSKMIIFLVIFACFGLIKEYIAALIALMLLRSNSGGIHCKHYLSCFVVSLLVLAANVFTGIHYPIPRLYSIVILLFCAIAGYLLSPIVSGNRPQPEEAIIRRSKWHTLCVILIFCLVTCICPSSIYLTIGIWTTIIHILQLLLAKFIQRRRAICSLY